MGIYRTIRDRWARKENPVAGVILAMAGANGDVRRQRGSGDPARMAKEGYQGNVYAYACIRMVAKAVGGVPWFVQQRRGRNVRDVLEGPLVDLIQRPNPTMGQSQFFENLTGYLYLTGDSFATKVRVGGRTDELWPLRPDRMSILKGTTQGMVNGYVYGAGQRKQTLKAEDVVHLKTWNPLDDWHGQSVLSAARHSVDQSTMAKQWNLALLTNGARPSGNLHFDGQNLTEEEKQAIKGEITRRFSGPQQAGSILVTEGAAQWHQMGLSPSDMEWLESQKLSAREIAIACGVPPQLVGVPDTQTYSNYKEARRALYEETVLPLLDFIRDELNHALVPEFGDGLRLEYDKDSIEAIAEGQETLWSRAEGAVDRGILSRNEAREMLGKERVDSEGMDDYMVPMTHVPLGSNPVSSGGGNDEEEAKGIQRKGLTAFRAQTDEDRQAFWKSIEESRSRWDKAMVKHVWKRFDAERDAVVEALRDATVDNAERVLEEVTEGQQKEWRRTMMALYLTVGNHYAEEVYTDLAAEKGLPGARTKSEDDEVVDPWAVEVQTWMADEGGEEIVSLAATIRETTLKTLRREIGEGVAAGEGIDTIARRVKKSYDGWSASRSMTIARTEVASAANVGSLSGAKGLAKRYGLDVRRRWLATEDKDSRETHGAEMNGHPEIKLDEKYRVRKLGGGIEQMKHPCEARASAANRINCRCTETFRVA